MKLKLHTLLAYIAFDELITQSEVWARNLQRQVLGYSSEAISRRIIQRAVEIGCYPFTGYFFKNAELSNGKVVSDTHSFSGLTIFERSGRLSLSLRLRLTLVYGFIKYYVYIYYRVTRNFICGRKFKEGSATLLFGAESFADGVEERFSEYLSEGPISPLVTASRIIVENKSTALKDKESERLQFDKFPLIRLLEDNAITFEEYLFFCGQHFFSGGVFLLNAICFSEMAFLGRDFAFQALVEHLNKFSLIENIVLTNSFFSSQPLWMMDYKDRHYRTHMVWYAQNVRPIAYKADGIQSDFPHYRHLHCDEHWVWTEEFRDYLTSIDVNSKIHIVGPILFYLCPPKLNLQRRFDREEVLISLFDVTPVRNEIRIKNGLGDYYCTKNMTLFLTEIVEVMNFLKTVLNINFRIILKTKRAYAPVHDPKYLDFLEDLEQKGLIELLLYNENLYSLISNSDVVIAPPYSSPVLIGHKLGVPSIFFDPTQDVASVFSNKANVFFASGRQELVGLIRESITRKLAKQRMSDRSVTNDSYRKTTC